MDVREHAYVMLEATRFTKSERCLQEKGPTDLMMVVHIVDTKERVFVALLPNRDFIMEGVRAVTPKKSVLAFVGVCADAYGRAYPAGTDVESVRRGEIAERFGLGDMTVREELIITVIDVATDELFAVTQCYHYDDGGMPHFDEPVEFAGDQTGQVCDNLRTVARRARRRIS